MAKKKTNPQSEDNKPPKSQHEAPRQTGDDDASAKLESLKSLNARLLKETVDRRQQVDSLTQINESLESELNRCKSDNVSLQSELSGLTERAATLEIEKESVSIFVSSQLDEMTEVNRRERAAMEEKIIGLERNMSRVSEEKNAIEKEKNKKESEIGSLNDALSKVCDERDGIRAQLHGRIQYEKDLTSKLTEAEKREAEITVNSQKMKAAYVGLVEEKKSMERKVDSILKDKASVEMNLVESNRLVDVLKREIEKIMKENMEINGDRDLQERKKNELNVSVHRLNELVYKLKMEQEQLLMKIADLENKHVMDSEKEAKMSIEIGVLVQEKQEIEASIQKLTQEKCSVSKSLNEALTMIEHQKLTINLMVEEKSKFKEQSADFKNTIAAMEKSNKVQIDIIKQLETEISNHKAAIDRATTQSKTAQANLDDEKLKLKNSNEKMSKLEKGIEETRKKLSKMTTETGKLVAEKNKLAETLAKTRKEHDDMKDKLKLSEGKKSKILKILKTTNLIRSSKEDDHTGIDQEIKNHVKEIEAIKKAVKDKEGTVEELKNKLELLNKGKSFWTMVSSATTVLAAVSLAYAARGC